MYTLFRLIFIDHQNVGVIFAAPCTTQSNDRIPNYTLKVKVFSLEKNVSTALKTQRRGWVFGTSLSYSGGPVFIYRLAVWLSFLTLSVGSLNVSRQLPFYCSPRTFPSISMIFSHYVLWKVISNRTTICQQTFSGLSLC